jgi:small nuclear ribonucleoprotein (snRNP)-like protein
MDEPGSIGHELEALIGQEVVVDVKDPHLYIGTLGGIGQSVVVLKNADVHFCGDSLTTTELYLVETRKNGVRPNRREVYVLRSEIVSISRLEDVIEY